MVRFITGRMQEEKIKKQPPETAAYHSKGTRYRAFTNQLSAIIHNKKQGIIYFFKIMPCFVTLS